MKGQGFTKTFPSIYVLHEKSAYFGHWVLIYFIFQLLLENEKEAELTLFSF